MSTFDIPKNLVALLGALTLAALLASAHPVQAEESPNVSVTPRVEPLDDVAHHIELNTLRKLLSAPRLSFEEHQQLRLELNEIEEESA